MYFSMGHMMWGWPLPSFYADNHVAMGLTQLLLTVVIMVINQRFFISGFKALWHRAPNMDTLVALGSTAAFVYSTYALFAMTGAQVRGDMDAVMDYMMDFYFESAAMILTLITVGKMLEARSKGKTTDALKSLMKLAPKTATVVRNGTGRDRSHRAGAVRRYLRRPPRREHPGRRRGAQAAQAQSTKRRLPARASPPTRLPAIPFPPRPSISRAFSPAAPPAWDEDTTLSQIIQMVSDAAATKAPIAKIADKVSGIFVPAVISIALVTTVVWLLIGKPFGYSACARNFRARHQLPVRAGSCDPGRHHGRKRPRRKERHSL